MTINSGKILVVLFMIFSWVTVTGVGSVVAYFGLPGLAVAAVLIGWARVSVFDLLVLSGTGIVAFGISALHSDTGFLHPFMALVTYSSVAILILRFPCRGDELVKTLITTVIWFSLAEAFIGMIQFVIANGGLKFSRGGDGDVVKGTVGGAHSHLYAMKMMFQSLLLGSIWVYARRHRLKIANEWLHIAATIAAALGSLFASFLTGTIVCTAGVVGFEAFRLLSSIHRIRVKSIVQMMVGGMIGLFGVGLVAATQPDNVRIITSALTKFTTEGTRDRVRFQKFISFKQGISEVLMADNDRALVGMGIGRYCSRAAMILSGGYLGPHPEWIPISRSHETSIYIYPLWNPRVWENYGKSIMGMPTSSAQALIVEFGILGSAFLFWYIWTLAHRARIQLERSPGLEMTLRGALLWQIPMIIAATLACSFTDLWLEFGSFASTIYLYIAVALSRPTGESRPA